MKKFWFLALICALVLASCNNSAPALTPTVTIRTDYKLGLVLNAQGTIRDGTFNEFAYKGAQRASREFGLDFAYRETKEDKNYPGAIDTMIKDGRNIIVTVGFQMADATLAAAQANPKAFFILVDAMPDGAPANLTGVLFREDQGGFLAGAMAAMMTKTNVVGVVGGMQIPPVERYVNGFINGAKYLNINIEVLSVYAGSFSDIDLGRTEADKMLEKNADVLFGAGGLLGSSAIVRAAEMGKFVIGVDQDEFATTFKAGTNAGQIITSAVKRVDTGVYAAIDSVLKGTAEGGVKLLSVANCGVSYAPANLADAAVPAAVKTRMEAIWRALAGGTLETGADQAGATAPASLAADALPSIADNAPKLSDCVS
jgi:basic membrane protein A and related proteins